MRAFVIAGFALAIVACGPGATPTPAPTEIPEASATPGPVATSTALVPTEPPTATATTTATEAPTATQIATETGSDATPTTSAAGAAEARGKPLEVEFTQPHYECRKECWEARIARPGDRIWTYRSFQILMSVENVSADLMLEGGQGPDDGWAPDRWIITDGSSEWVETYPWQWVMVVGGSHQPFYARPDVPPGSKSEWTWLSVPIPPGAWVKAVEYEDPWGNLYRQDFPRPEPGQFNYVDCGEPREGSC